MYGYHYLYTGFQKVILKESEKYNTLNTNKHMPDQNFDNFSSNSYMLVESSFLRSFSFGLLQLGGTNLNAVLVEFCSGAQYLYIGLSSPDYVALYDACYANQQDSSNRVSPAFHRILQPYQCYSRLHQAI